MTEQTELGIQNAKRSATKVRQLGPEDLDIPVEDQEDAGTGWDTLVDRAETATGEGTPAVVRTENGAVRTGSPLRRGRSQSVHALELAILKAYDDTASDIENALYTPDDGSEYPCGRCLQILHDYAAEDAVLGILREDTIEKTLVRDLIPC